MYSILIVDDERTEREGIEKLIKKYGYELEILQTSNGEKALNIFNNKNIDILITDIKMPFMNGIELIRILRQRGFEPFCVIYSAYGEFEYAQKAISLGVSQYLLKPIKLSEFESLFETIFKTLDKKQKKTNEDNKLKLKLKDAEIAYQMNTFIKWLDNENNKIPDFLDKNSTYIPIILSSYSNIFSQNWDTYKSDLYEIFGKQSIIINKNDMQIIILLKNFKFNANLLASKSKLVINLSINQYKSNMFIVIGTECNNLDKLKMEYNKIYEKLDYQFFITKSVFFIYDEQNYTEKNNEILPLHFEKILTFTSIYDFDGVINEFEKVFEYIEKNIGFSSIYIKYNFTKIMQKCCEVLKCNDKMMHILQKIYDSTSLSDVKSCIFDFINKLSMENFENKNDKNRIITMAQKIIEENYSDYNLNVSSIALRLGISSAYMSTLFKTNTKQNMVKYISEFRIEKAKHLLKDTNLKISEVGKKVGYLNTSYFVSLFRNIVGISPNKYRESNNL